MNGLLPSPILAAALLMSACGDGVADAAKQMAAAADSTRHTVDLATYHIPLTLEVPAGMPAPTIVWKDELGKLDIQAGDRFHMEITEGPADMDRLKADLDRDLVKRNTILQESPDLLVYRSEFPDDTTLVFFHFRRAITVGDRSFRIEDPDDGDAFTNGDVLKMAGAVTAKNPV